MRRIISAMLCICIVLTLFSGITVSAQEASETLYDRVRIAAQSFNETVDISDLNLGENRKAVLSEVIEKITNEPEFFYVSSGFSHSSSKLILSFSYNKSEAEVMRAEYEAVANEMVEDLKSSDLSDVYKALLIHDRLAVLCEYDYENYKSGIEFIPNDSYTVYGALVNRIAVCEGYSKAYKYMLSLVGIDSEVCASKQLKHMWNKVEIDGKWYYVDVTHDDPVDDIVGRVNHDNFLVSYAEISKPGGSHVADDYDDSLDNTEYDDYYWESSDTEFQYIGGEIYYFDNIKGELKRLSDNFVIDTISDNWLAGENSYWAGNYTRISSCDENIYYSGKDTVYIYHTITGFHHEVLAPHLPEHLEIYGLSYEKDELGKKFVFEYRDCPGERRLQGGQVVPTEISEKQFYFDIKGHEYSGLVSGEDEKWHYVVNGEPCLDTGIFEIGETRFYIVDGLRHSGVALIEDIDGAEHYVEDGVLTEKTGLFKVGENEYYIKDGIRQHYTGFLRVNNATIYYIKDGIKNHAECTHLYDNTCDTTCNVCGAVRGITHAYRDYVTKATLKKNGSIVRKCAVCGSVYKKTTVYYPKTIKLSATSYTYNGKTKTPTVTVKGSNGKTISKSYYTVKYASGRKNVGKYKVTITFKGNYSGTKTLYFTINPVKTSVTKLTAAKKALTVSISKKSKQVTGYEIQYATNKKFSKAKKATIKSYKTTKTTLKKLSAKKTYYVRVRTYKTVGKTKYYSGWSTVKYKKTK